MNENAKKVSAIGFKTFIHICIDIDIMIWLLSKPLLLLFTIVVIK